MTAVAAKHAGETGVALVIIDMINPLDFPGAEDIAHKADQVSRVILELRSEADGLGVPVVYVNDNYGHWHSDRSKIVAHCRAASKAAAEIVGRLAPRESDYFVIKPQFSGFYATNLPVLLPNIGASRLVLSGVAGDICVLFTAAAAHMRDYDLWVPADAVASEHDERNSWALDIMRKSMDADISTTTELTLARWKNSVSAARGDRDGSKMITGYSLLAAGDE